METESRIKNPRARASSVRGRQELRIRMPAIAILGPTSSGKSDLAIWLARKFNGEIVSVDSRQVYRGMDLGTGKVTKMEQQLASHHMIDIVVPGKTYTVAQFKKRADKEIEKIFKRGHIPILVGGSHLYMRALLYNYTIPKVKPDAKYRKLLESKTTKRLLSLLKKVDEPYYDIVDQQNRRRLIRALEVYHASGKKFSSLTGSQSSKYDVLKIGIHSDRTALYKKIDERVDARVRKGMIREVQRLRESGVSQKWLKGIGLEYRFISEYLTIIQKLKVQSLKLKVRNEMLQLLKYATHDFARRQLTWYRRENDITYVTSYTAAQNIVKRFLASL